MVGRDSGSQVSKDNELGGKGMVTEQCPCENIYFFSWIEFIYHKSYFILKCR